MTSIHNITNSSKNDQTRSLCPVCLKRIDATRRKQNQEVWLDKHCSLHGDFSTRIWQGPPFWDDWQRPKKPAAEGPGYQPVSKGCPFDCGLCRDHRQRSCTVLIDVTQRCNLVCPVCFASSTRKGGTAKDPGLDELRRRFKSVFEMSPGSNIQLSGGEPTLRDDLPEIVRICKQEGFNFVQVNTNGIRMAQDKPYVESLAKSGLNSIFFQFDGTTDDIFLKLRGKALLETKLSVIEQCEKTNLGVVLVVTVVPGVNDDNLGAILDLAVKNSPVIRGVHFQPISYFGRFPTAPGPGDRITLPELMRAIEAQSRKTFPADYFSPSGCENAMCSFSARFLVQSDHSIHPLVPVWQGCCGTMEPAEEGAKKSIAQTARQWSGSPRSMAPSVEDAATQVLDLTGKKNPIDLDQFLRQVPARTLTVSAMAFQDAWTLDLDRVRECCIHVADDRNRLIPFCLYNLTSMSGKGLYRP